jgi:cytoskeletal protein RodZ
MDKGTFGEHLRREREMRGVSLEEISAATRIGTRFLEALESEQWERLPGGVFNRGFVRAVARFLGLDEEGMVGEYALATTDRPGTRLGAEKQPALGSEASRLLWLLVLLAVALVAGAWFAWHHYASWRAGRRPAAVSAPRPASHLPAAPRAATPVDDPVPPPASAAGPTRKNLKKTPGGPD